MKIKNEMPEVRTGFPVTAVLLIGGGLLLWIASPAIVVILAAIIVAVLFDAGTRALAFLPLPRNMRLIAVLVIAVGVIVGAAYLGGAIVLQQANELVAETRRVLSDLAEVFARYRLDGSDPEMSQWLPSSDWIVGGATRIATTSFGVVATAAVVFFLGAFFAWEPQVYKSGILSVLPPRRRERIGEALDRSVEAMRAWIVGQSISMMVIFFFTLGALNLIGMPYPNLLALQAGILSFIPTVGPFAAGAIIILAGLSHSMTMAAYGVAAYIAVQFLESNILTPLVQQRMTRLPPGFTLGVQLVFGVLFGLVGLAFAVPLAAAGVVLVRELYVNDRLGGGYVAPD